MSHSQAKADSIPMSKDKNGFNWYHPPCQYCDSPVDSWRYISGAKYTCIECRKYLIDNKINIATPVAKKEQKLKSAVKRISKVTNINLYQEAIKYVENNINKHGWFQSTEEIMVALELIRCKIKTYHQVKVYGYTVDFVLPDLKVVLEIDGLLFHGKERKDRENIRDTAIVDKFGAGWEVIRIQTDNINKNISKLLPAIKAVLKKRNL